jgi:hypothetical protein
MWAKMQQEKVSTVLFFLLNVRNFKGQSCIPGSSLIAGKIVQLQVKTILIANEISHFKIYQP